MDDYYRIYGWGESAPDAQRQFDALRDEYDTFLLEQCGRMLPKPGAVVYHVEYLPMDQPSLKIPFLGQSKISFAEACRTVDDALCGKAMYSVQSRQSASEATELVKRLFSEHLFVPSRFMVEAFYVLDDKVKAFIQLKQRMVNGKTLEDVLRELGIKN